MSTRNEIPQWAWYNGQVMFHLSDALETDPTQTISHFVSSFQKSQNFPSNFNFKNQGVLLSLLYGLLVVPKELWEKGSSQTQFPFRTRQYFSFELGNTMDTANFLRCMRNAISHANFDVNIDPPVYQFWNIGGNGTKNFEVKISHGDLGLFVSEVGKYYVNEVCPR
jgi:hypothetical protein